MYFIYEIKTITITIITITITKEPMQTREIPVLPWQIVASDVLEHKNQNYLVVIDYYSKYIEVIRLNGKTSGDIIGCLNEIF